MLVHELQPAPEASHVFQRLAHLPHCLFLDSAMADQELGRYSFVTAAPFRVLRESIGAADPFQELHSALLDYDVETLPDLPPFQGGAAGLFSYDLASSLEQIPAPIQDEFQLPALFVGLYDFVVAFDHVEKRAWIICQGITGAGSRSPQQAIERRDQVIDLLQQAPRDIERTESIAPLTEDQLCPQFPVGDIPGLRSDFSDDDYRRAVARAVEYIRAGDVFQVNLSQRLLFPQRDDSISLYLRLRERNAATFAGYFDLGEAQLVSASPERFVRVRDRVVEARPIKGTRRRVMRPEADLLAGDELLESEKDRAENVMILDLLRNDLSRVCVPDSIQVTDLCRLEVYQFVQHLVSVVRGELQEGRTAMDLVRAAFPGGSITGAPKVRAMEIIAELEPTARGPYCGSLGYLGFDGAMDLSILIRTITVARGWWQMPVGGGIVAQSDPQREYEETWHKAKGMLAALSPQS